MLIFLYIIILIITLFNPSFQTNDYIITNLTYYNNDSILVADIDYNESKIFNISDYDISPINNTDKIVLIKKLQLIVSLECDSIFHYQIIDREKKRFIADFVDEDYKNNLKYCKNFLNLNEFGFKIGNINETFTFSITINNETIYILNNYQFLYSDTLIVFTQELTSKYIFGFGERRFDFNLLDGKYTIRPNDTGHTYRDQLNGGWNLMGHQPIGLHKTKNNLYMGMIFMNSNAQDVIIKILDNNNDNKENNNKKYNLEHRTIGGIINYYLVFGNSPEHAILNIHKIIGRPTIPPYWGLGWHQCRWGYNNTQNVINVNENYSFHNIPLDGLWTDVDMMENAYNFHLKFSYKDMPEFIKTLHENDGRKFVALVDYAIPYNTTEKYYKLGMEKNAFILSNYTNEPLISTVWPGKSVFPDLFIPGGIEMWKTGLNDYFELLDYDGMWIDMNEPGAIEIFPLGKDEIIDNSLYNQTEKDIYRFLPYLPGYKSETHQYGNLQTKAISLNAYSHLNDPENNFYTMHNVRIFISRHQVKATNEYLKSVMNHELGGYKPPVAKKPWHSFISGPFKKLYNIGEPVAPKQNPSPSQVGLSKATDYFYTLQRDGVINAKNERFWTDEQRQNDQTVRARFKEEKTPWTNSRYINPSVGPDKHQFSQFVDNEWRRYNKLRKAKEKEMKREMRLIQKTQEKKLKRKEKRRNKKNKKLFNKEKIDSNNEQENE